MFGLKSAQPEQLKDSSRPITERTLFDFKISKRGELLTAEAAAGESYLSGNGAGVGAVLSLKEEIAAIDRALDLLRSRRPAAIREDFLIKARDLRRQSAAKSAELQLLEDGASKLHNQLRDLEGCPFAAAGTPKSSLLRSQIAELDRAAQDLEQLEVPTSGTIDIDGVTNFAVVLEALSSYPAIGPKVEEVVNWLMACELAAQKSRNSRFGSHPRRVMLIWDSDGIRPESSIFCEALVAQRKGNFSDSSYVLDVASATFRAGAVTTTLGDVPGGIEEKHVRRPSFYRG
jgi:hypothetical protein